MAKDKNYVSVWFWLFAMVVTALPCVGFLFVLIFAFIGENDSRKNFFKAILLLYVLVIGILVAMYGVGFGFVVWKYVSDHWQEWPKFLRGE